MVLLKPVCKGRVIAAQRKTQHRELALCADGPNRKQRLKRNVVDNRAIGILWFPVLSIPFSKGDSRLPWSGRRLCGFARLRLDLQARTGQKASTGTSCRDGFF